MPVTEILREIGAIAHEIILTAPPMKRAADPHEIAKLARHYGLKTTIIPEIGAALQSLKSRLSPDECLLITGSFFVVGEGRKWYAPL